MNVWTRPNVPCSKTALSWFNMELLTSALFLSNTFYKLKWYFKDPKSEPATLLPKILQGMSITLRLKSKICNIFVRTQCDLGLDCHFILCHSYLGHQAQVSSPLLSSANMPYSFHVLHICCSLPRMVPFCLFTWKTTIQSLNVSFKATLSARTVLMRLYWVRFIDIWSLRSLTNMCRMHTCNCSQDAFMPKTWSRLK